MIPQHLAEKVHAYALELLRDRVLTSPVISSWNALEDYVYANLAHSPIEMLHVLYLDRKNRLIADEILARGTVDHVPVYPREVLKRAIENDASAIILAHNHPSGDPLPSTVDIDMTLNIQRALQPLGITLHDHVIVGSSPRSCYSMRAHGNL